MSTSRAYDTNCIVVFHHGQCTPHAGRRARVAFLSAKADKFQDDFKQAKSAYQENRTLRFGYRLVQLRELYNAIVQNHTELLKAAQTDTGRPLAVWQHTYRHVLDGIVVEARSLLFQLNKGQKHKLSVVPDSTVLVIGTEQGIKHTNSLLE